MSDTAKPPRLEVAGGQDRVFVDPASTEVDFQFDGKTVAVFDDMVERSVPMYGEIQRLTTELAGDFAVPGSRLYDLGCSTATTLLNLDATLPPGVAFVGIDNAPEMLAKARAKFAARGTHRDVQFIAADLQRDRVVEDASVVILLLTLQFIRPLNREHVIRRIYEGMREQSALILVEKIIVDNGMFNRLFIRHYYDMKRRNGYSESEIAHKREALENVLIPYRPDENVKLLRDAGFSQVEEFFRWYNFNGLVAVK
ncbi:MAG: carboxy-S-adenosyl-L-methionine synthase CmoA [Gammaproteobacteria bacterium]|nr:carboxy-S-adenosyl-L-methionine synthase CmoA [Gammaproteobacteria bacterium]